MYNLLTLTPPDSSSSSSMITTDFYSTTRLGEGGGAGGGREGDWGGLSNAAHVNLRETHRDAHVSHVRRSPHQLPHALILFQSVP